MCDVCFEPEARPLVCGHRICGACESVLMDDPKPCFVSDLCDGNTLVPESKSPAMCLERVQNRISYQSKYIETKLRRREFMVEAIATYDWTLFEVQNYLAEEGIWHFARLCSILDERLSTKKVSQWSRHLNCTSRLYVLITLNTEFQPKLAELWNMCSKRRAIGLKVRFDDLTIDQIISRASTLRLCEGLTVAFNEHDVEDFYARYRFEWKCALFSGFSNSLGLEVLNLSRMSSTEHCWLWARQAVITKRKTRLLSQLGYSKSVELASRKLKTLEMQSELLERLIEIQPSEAPHPEVSSRLGYYPGVDVNWGLQAAALIKERLDPLIERIEALMWCAQLDRVWPLLFCENHTLQSEGPRSGGICLVRSSHRGQYHGWTLLSLVGDFMKPDSVELDRKTHLSRLSIKGPLVIGNCVYDPRTKVTIDISNTETFGQVNKEVVLDQCKRSEFPVFKYEQVGLAFRYLNDQEDTIKCRPISAYKLRLERR